MEDLSFSSFANLALGIDGSPVSTVSSTLRRSHVDPPPFLDVLSFRSTRLLPESREEIAAHELQLKKNRGLPSHSTSKLILSPEEEAARLDELLTSVHLLLEPIQLPDLSHTGVFSPDTSLLRPVTPLKSIPKPQAESTAKLKLSKVDKSDEIKLFYPTGAKNSNIRDYIKETIQKHFSTAVLQQNSDKALAISASDPVFRTSVSPSKNRSVKTTKKKNKLKGIKSPVKTSLTTGALLNPQLTKQAKDIIAAVRANSSKINNLISKLYKSI
ncbi:hypothetical protein P3T76_001770 [Phytophthora citrophthora]|uniref:Uncharacterized protein n=1 Tax=Phytophthora citrophthora TaxID=4793 RepID=A0AAD9GWS9_9STRA|nr:hypothetical protein P3T76_001770 [Phytophthora citrophthora]